jgi:hypothetical protein
MECGTCPRQAGLAPAFVCDQTNIAPAQTPACLAGGEVLQEILAHSAAKAIRSAHRFAIE